LFNTIITNGINDNKTITFFQVQAMQKLHERQAAKRKQQVKKITEKRKKRKRKQTPSTKAIKPSAKKARVATTTT